MKKKTKKKKKTFRLPPTLDIKVQTKLMKMLPAVTKRLANITGILDIGVGLKSSKKRLRNIPAFVVFVAKKFTKKELRKAHVLMPTYRGIPIDVVETQPRYHELSKADPLIPGISISNPRFSAWGTVGLYVNGKNGEGQMGLTNFHVAVLPALPKVKQAAIGDHINQPGNMPDTPDNNIGTLTRFDRNFDCAVFALNGSRALNNQVAGQNFGQPVKAQAGMLVKKTGAATGTTFGQIQSCGNNTFTIAMNPNKHIEGKALSSGGDSGSVWVTDDGNNNLLGLHFGGDNLVAFAVYIDDVFNSLAITLP